MLGKVEGWLVYLERMKKKTDWKSRNYFEELTVRLLQAAAVIFHPVCANGRSVTNLMAGIVAHLHLCR
ncbi:hypothetical protein BDR22DRAFT_876939 [Usnea florida]